MGSKAKSKTLPVVEVETAATRSAALVAAKLRVREERAAERKILLSPELLAAIEAKYPRGTRVRYIGGRVGERTGAEGVVVDYRDGNGLVIEFENGSGGTYRGTAVPGRVIVLEPPPVAPAGKSKRK
jgi:hypothetical protein